MNYSISIKAVRNGIGLAAMAAVTLSALGGLRAERPRVYAITQVRIVTAPGQVIERAGIVLRDGLIEALGKDVQAPPDAQVIEAEEDWTVYPAFIDGASHLGVPEERRGPGGGGGPPNPAAALAQLAQQPEQPGGAPHELPSVHPEKAVIDGVKLEKDAVERHRKLGFAIVHSLPRSGIFRGRSVVLSLGDGDVRGQVIRDRLAQVVALESGGFARRQYPTSKIGALAAVRQALLDARRQALWEERLRANPVGLERPEFRSSDAALQDILDQRVPVLFVAQSDLDHDRFGQLTREFGLSGFVLARGCHEEARRLQASSLPVLLPLKFPEKPKVDDADELETISLESLQEYLNAPRLPGQLQGVQFALTGDPGGSNSDFFKNLAKVVEAGLSRERALAALTVEPARMLGIGEVAGTLEPGKLANLLVVKGELFTEQPELRYVFVDGRDYEMEAKVQKGDPDAQVDPRGVWEITTRMMGRSNESKWHIQGSPGAYTGYAEGRQGQRDFESVQLQGNALTVRLPGPARTLEVTVVIEGDTLSGDSSFETPRGSMTIKVEGKRVSGPEEGKR